MRNGPFTIDEVYYRLSESLGFSDEADVLFEEFLAEQEEEDPLIDLSPVQGINSDGVPVFRVSINLSESGNELASHLFETEEQGQQFIDVLLLLQELSEHGLH